jgi:hypothetical protein
MAGVTIRHRAFATVALAFAAAPPARAGTETFPVFPAAADTQTVADEDPVLSASAWFPRGRVEKVDDVGPFWSGPRAHGCRPSLIVAAYAWTRPAHLPRNTSRGSATTVAVKTSTGPRAVSASSYTLHASDLAFGGVLRLRLPADLLPAYPRRTITLTVVTFRLARRCRAVQRRATRIAKSVLDRASITVPASYTPPAPP